MAGWMPNRPMMGSRPWGTPPAPQANIMAPINQAPYPTGGYSGYYDPTNFYGGQAGMVNSPLVGGPAGYLAQNPQAAYTRATGGFAGGEDPFSRFVRNQYGQTYQGFQAAQASNPNLSFANNYLPSLGGEQFFRNRFLSQAPIARGELPAGRMRWFFNR